MTTPVAPALGAWQRLAVGLPHLQQRALPPGRGRPFVASQGAVPRPGRRLHVSCAVMALALSAVAGAACGEPSGPTEAPTLPGQAPRGTKLTSRDGVLALALPIDLLVHRHLHGLQGTRIDGSLRLQIEHLPADKVIRLVGHAKDVLTRRGWEVSQERHYEYASELKLRQGPRAAPTLLRSMWFVPERGRVLLCDGIGDPRWEARLGEAFGALCRSVELQPPTAPSPDAPDGGAPQDAVPGEG